MAHPRVHHAPAWRLAASDNDHVAYTTNLNLALTFTRDELLAARVNGQAFSDLVERKQSSMRESVMALIGGCVAEVVQEALHQ